jgi:drug/metabolite transporter (DMT)-like permease
LVLAATCYIAAYGLVDEATHKNRTLAVYSSVAAAAALVAAHLTLQGASLAILLALGALVCSASSSWRSSLSLAIHGAVYVLAAAFASGLLGGTIRTLWGSSRLPELLASPAWIVLIVSIATTLMPPASSPSLERRIGKARLPAMLLAAITIAALVVAMACGFGSEISETELTTSSILRSTVICLSAILLALLSRNQRFVQSRWLVIPFLLLGAVKLIVQDLPSGEPSILFGSLGVFGAALIIAPRLLSSSTKPAPKSDSPPGRAAEYSAPS